MNEPRPGLPADDDALEELLRQAAARYDPVPPHLILSALEAYTLSSMDAELAELTFDSLTEAAAVRGPGDGQPRLLTFSGAGLTLDLEIWSGRVVGQIMPPQPAEVELLGPARVTVSADALGRFAYDRASVGRFALRCSTPDAQIVTEWVTG